MTKIKKLNKRVVLDLTKSDLLQLRGGQKDQEDVAPKIRTVAHDTHVNTCFTKNCCNSSTEFDIL